MTALGRKRATKAVWSAMHLFPVAQTTEWLSRVMFYSWNLGGLFKVTPDFVCGSNPVQPSQLHGSEKQGEEIKEPFPDSLGKA